MPEKETRFIRLINLLGHESFSVREEASRQLACFASDAVRTKRTAEISNLLRRLDFLLIGSTDHSNLVQSEEACLEELSTSIKCSTWNVRMSVAGLLSELANSVDPSALKFSETNTKQTKHKSLNIGSLDLKTLLSKGLPLFGTSGDEYDVYTATDDESDFERQRLALLAWLGQELATQQREENIAEERSKKKNCSKSSQSISNDDDESSSEEENVRESESRKLVQDDVRRLISNEDLVSKRSQIVDEEKSTSIVSKSVRERNRDRAKLRRGALLKRREEDSRGIDFGVSESFSKKGEEITLTIFCYRLRARLLSSSWEIRHGAAVVLRSILASPLGGVVSDSQSSELSRWLEDCAARCLCVLVLDRFGDYVAESVIAPASEACAQLLATIAWRMPIAFSTILFQVLVTMQNFSHWQVRHSSMLTIKYLVPALLKRQNMNQTIRKTQQLSSMMDMLPEALYAAARGIADKDDDVRGAAADAALPLISLVTTVGENNATKKATIQLSLATWNALPLIDKLSPAKASLVSLLAELYSTNSMLESVINFSSSEDEIESSRHKRRKISRNLKQDNSGSSDRAVNASVRSVQLDLTKRVPTLWPLVISTEPLAKVRLAAMKTLYRLLCVPGKWLNANFIEEFMQVVYANIIFEVDEGVVSMASMTWQKLVSTYSDLISISISAHVSGRQLTRKRRKPNSMSRITSLFKTWFIAAAKIFSKIISSIEEEETSKNSTERCISAVTALAELGRMLGEKVVAMMCQIVLSEMQTGDSNSRKHVAILLIAELGRMGTFQMKTLKEETVQFNNSILQLCKPVQSKNESNADRILYSISAAAIVYLTDPKTTPCYKLNQVLPILMQSVRLQRCLSFQRYSANAIVRVIRFCVDMKTTHVFGERGYRVVAKLISNACVMLFPNDPPEMKNLTLPTAGNFTSDENSVGLLAAAKAQYFAENDYKSWRIGAEIMLRSLVQMLRENKASRNGECIFVTLPTLGKHVRAIKSSSGCMEVEKIKVTVRSIRLIRCLVDAVQLNTSASCVLLDTTLDIVSLACTGGRRVPTLGNFSSDQKLDTTRNEYIAAEAANCLVHFVICDGFDATLAPLWRILVIDIIIRNVPSFLSSREPIFRRHAADLIWRLVKNLHDDLLSFVSILVRPVLRACNDCSGNKANAKEVVDASRAANRCFASLLEILPLLNDSGSLLRPVVDCDGHLAEATDAWDRLETARKLDGAFFGKLLGCGSSDDNNDVFNLVVCRKDLQLRNYQRRGIRWLWFLRSCGLHGLLGDEMGLGKTLQTLWILYAHQVSVAKLNTRKNSLSPAISGKKSPDIGDEKGKIEFHPSLIVCPATLVEHWVVEASKFFPSVAAAGHDGKVIPGCVVVAYRGKSRKARSLALYNVLASSCTAVVTSYGMLRSDIGILEKKKWGYVVLDEGHMIKNPSTAVSCAAKRLQAENRLVLTGTPLANHTSELWSIFDFLMPNFLGKRADFRREFEEPIAAARRALRDVDADASTSEMTTISIAKNSTLKRLHNRLLPLMLRRCKCDVLEELPEKVIVDRSCVLPKAQRLVYDSLYKELRNSGKGSLGDKESLTSASSLRYLKCLLRACTHPLLADTKHAPVTRRSNGSLVCGLGLGLIDVEGLDPVAIKSFSRYQCSGKLVALRDLLIECGIGAYEAVRSDQCKESDDEGSDQAPEMIPPHRALIFAQFKSSLDLVESQLLRNAMPSVSYLRIDGDVPVSERSGIAKRFNEDPSTDLLLLTSSVGGLGLNLTGADTVIFLEHDWNPQRDLQAMDRAHRIGQKRNVTVYRLLARDTIEERLLGLQRFKLGISGAIFNQDNATISGMGVREALQIIGCTSKNMVSNVTAHKSGDDDDLWDESEYANLYNVEKFLDGIN
eukprot:g3666.t1